MKHLLYFILFSMLPLSAVAQSSLAKASIKKLKQEAESGNVEAQYQLAMRYEYGAKPANNSAYQKAMNEEQEAAKVRHNSVVGSNQKLHDNDQKKAEQLKAETDRQKTLETKNSGSRKLQGADAVPGQIGKDYSVGTGYHYNGTSKDMEKAVYWYQKAAEQGHTESQFRLAMCYANGTGVAKDPE